jgi:ribosomal protein S18 acetylase RimI-like enzyme
MHLLHIEETYANVIPALETFLYDGWLVRVSNGNGNNNNSVWPLYDGTLPIGTKIDFFESVYLRRGYSCRFRIPSFQDHDELQRILQDRGYAVDNPNLVMVRTDVDSPEGRVSRVSREEWLRAVMRTNPDEGGDPSWEVTLRNIPVPHCFAVLERGGQVLSYGRATVQGVLLNLEDLWTTPSERSQGHGTQLIHGLLAFGHTLGAGAAFLGVNEGNTRAQALYARLGFERAYDYHYLVAQ